MVLRVEDDYAIALYLICTPDFGSRRRNEKCAYCQLLHTPFLAFWSVGGGIQRFLRGLKVFAERIARFRLFLMPTGSRPSRACSLLCSSKRPADFNRPGPGDSQRGVKKRNRVTKCVSLCALPTYRRLGSHKLGAGNN